MASETAAMLYQAMVAVGGGGSAAYEEVFDAGGEPAEGDHGEGDGGGDRAGEVGIAGAVAAGGDGEGDGGPSGELGDERVDGG
jgi:hypothetical protein